MKTVKQSVLVTGALLMGATTLGALGSQTSSNWMDQWYQAKYGRNSPVTEAQLRAEQANMAFREEKTTMSANTWFEDFWRAKYGRNSPMEEARLRSEQANTAYREEKTAMPANTWLEDFSRMKYGRRPGTR